MPGGLGTLDELTELLTLMQTKKIKPYPVVLFGDEYWRGFLAWLKDSAMKWGLISEKDFDLFEFIIKKRGSGKNSELEKEERARSEMALSGD